MNRMEYIERILNRRWIYHIVFWLVVTGFYSFFFSHQYGNYGVIFWFVLLLLPLTIGTTYFLNNFLLPRYFFKKRYGLFVLCFFYTLIISLYFQILTIFGIFIFVARLNIRKLNLEEVDPFFLLISMYMVVFLGMALKMVRYHNKSQLQLQRLRQEKIEAELKFLKSQLNPHFLFNTLNNLYALTLVKSDKASEVVLKLSDMLNYVLHESKSDVVSLEREVGQVDNYIALEKLRYGDKLNVRFEKSGDFLRKYIPPMLLITLVENGFKHGVSKTMNDSWIGIDLRVSPMELNFEVENSSFPAKPAGMSNGQAGGIGLKNLESRLKLIYNEDYDLSIKSGVDRFKVSLKINITN